MYILVLQGISKGDFMPNIFITISILIFIWFAIALIHRATTISIYRSIFHTTYEEFQNKLNRPWMKIFLSYGQHLMMTISSAIQHDRTDILQQMIKTVDQSKLRPQEKAKALIAIFHMFLMHQDKENTYLALTTLQKYAQGQEIDDLNMHYEIHLNGSVAYIDPLLQRLQQIQQPDQKAVIHYLLAMQYQNAQSFPQAQEHFQQAINLTTNEQFKKALNQQIQQLQIQNENAE